jgi:hypothetical protein
MKYEILQIDEFGKAQKIAIDGSYDLEQMRCIIVGLEINDLQNHTYYIIVEGGE